jgi:hypothetical protein
MLIIFALDFIAYFYEKYELKYQLLYIVLIFKDKQDTFSGLSCYPLS